MNSRKRADAQGPFEKIDWRKSNERELPDPNVKIVLGAFRYVEKNISSITSRVASTILEHPVYGDANVCAISNTVTTIARPPSPAKGSNEPSVRIFVSYLRIAVVLTLMHFAQFTR